MAIFKNTVLSALLVFFLVPAKAQLKAGQKAIDFTAYQINGDSIKLSNLQGSYVLLQFSMYACAPCWESYPHLTELQDKYKETLKVITFHVDETPGRWDAHAKKLNLRVNWISVRHVKNKKEIVNHYDLQGLPHWFLIDQKGTIIEVLLGYKKGKLEKMVNKYLGS